MNRMPNGRRVAYGVPRSTPQPRFYEQETA